LFCVPLQDAEVKANKLQRNEVDRWLETLHGLWEIQNLKAGRVQRLLLARKIADLWAPTSVIDTKLPTTKAQDCIHSWSTHKMPSRALASHYNSIKQPLHVFHGV
jgi:hypothetical protein